MNELPSGKGRLRKTLMGLCFGVLYILLGLCVAVLVFLEHSPLAQVVGITCTLFGWSGVTLMLISWFKHERALKRQASSSMSSTAPPKTRLPFRIVGVLIALLMLASGCFFLAILIADWTHTLSNPVSSLTFAAMGLCGVVCGSLFGYCCLAAKVWPNSPIRH